MRTSKFAASRGVGAAPRRAGRAAAFVALLVIPAAVSACSHGPREFDVTPRVASERIAPPEPAAADLSGTWEFDPRASGQQVGGMQGGRGGGMRGGYGGRGGRPGGGGGFGGRGGMPPRAGEPDGGREGRGRGGDDSTLAAPRRLVLAQSDSSLTVSRAGGAAMTLYFDGRSVYVPDPRGEREMEVNGRWHGRRFEVRRDLANGRAVTETYELSKDGTTLTVRSRMSEGERSQAAPVEIRRVYRRAAEHGLGEEPGPPR